MRGFLDVMSSLREVDFVEIGYWKQLGKYSGPFYSVDEHLVRELSSSSSKPIAVMSDFHYLTVGPEDFTDAARAGLAMLRLTSRKQDLSAALSFLQEVRKLSGLQLSLNISNVSNYLPSELNDAIRMAAGYDIDVIYVADTHGTVELGSSVEYFRNLSDFLASTNKAFGVHLHNHRGLALSNYFSMMDAGFSYTDISLGGLGKGGGNLKSEQVLFGDDLFRVLDFKLRNSESFRLNANPFYLLSGLASVTDHYADEAFRRGLSVSQVAPIFDNISGIDKDTYNPKLIQENLKI